MGVWVVFFFQAEDGIRDDLVTGVQTCALPICRRAPPAPRSGSPATRGRSDPPSPARPRARSEERRVGKECRARWSPSHSKKNEMEKRMAVDQSKSTLAQGKT